VKGLTYYHILVGLFLSLIATLAPLELLEGNLTTTLLPGSS